jgi:calcyphosin
LAVLFSLYDQDESGSICYREFCSEIFGFEVGGTQPSHTTTNPDQLVDRLRQKLASRGARGIIGLQRQFKIMDDNHSMSLDRYEFAKAMADYALGFTENEIVNLFNYFDYNRTNLIEYDEFLRTVRGPMNPQRKAIVTKAFDILDKDASGYIELKDIQGVYNGSKHPDVL